jgi:ATP-binding cassette, subfamily B, bacterial
MNPIKKTILFRVFGLAKPYWFQLLVLFFINLLSTPLALLNPVPLKIVVDTAFGEEPLPGPIRRLFPPDFDFSLTWILALASGLIIVTALLSQVQGLFSWILQSYTGEKLVQKFRAVLFNHIQRLSLAYHDRTGISDSIYRIQYDAYAIWTLVVNGLSPFVTNLFTVAGMLYIMAVINLNFSLIAMAVMPGFIYFTRRSSAKLKTEWFKVKEVESSAMAVVHEAMSALRVVKAFVQEDYEERRFLKRSTEAVKGQMRLAYIGGWFNLVIGLLVAAGTALVLYLGALYVHQGRITLGELIIIMTYLAQLYGPLQALSRHITGLQQSLVGIERAYALIDSEKDVREAEHPVPVRNLTGLVVFDRVVFEYKPGEPVIRDLSFEIKPGQRVGIMGTTGSGKTTMLNLLARFYDPSSGSIVVDGRDIRDYRLSDYRSQFSIVLQEPVLFSTTIGENISYGRSDAGLHEIHEAARAANAHGFISKLEKGYDSEVGERGMQLSGGERQRISIARAFLKNAPILILDEPTSSVDIATEASIMEAMDRLMEGRTTFLITHRLETLIKCDALIHLENGIMVDFIINDQESSIMNKIQSIRSGILVT